MVGWWFGRSCFHPAIPPGPVVITVTFVGFLVAGPLGACAAAIGVFLPVYVVVVFVARWFHRLAANRSLRAVIDGVTAAATGAIAGAVGIVIQAVVT
jgi:chromate transporter